MEMQGFLITQTNFMKKLILLLAIVISLSGCVVVDPLLSYGVGYNRAYYYSRPYQYRPIYPHRYESYKHFRNPRSHYKFRY
jgi:hypothetical protein